MQPNECVEVVLVIIVRGQRGKHVTVAQPSYHASCCERACASAVLVLLLSLCDDEQCDVNRDSTRINGMYDDQ